MRYKIMGILGILSAALFAIMPMSQAGASVASDAAPAHTAGYVLVNAHQVPQHAAGRAMAAITSGEVCDNYGAGYCIESGVHGQIIYTETSGAYLTVEPVSGGYQLEEDDGLCVTWNSGDTVFTYESCTVNGNTTMANTSTDAIHNNGCGHNLTATGINVNAEIDCAGGPASDENQWLD